MPNSSLVYMLARIAEFLNCSNNDLLELISPDWVELIDLLVLLNSILGKVTYETLGRLSILFGLKSIVFHLLLSIFLRFVSMRFLLNLWRKNCWSWQNFVKMLKLLPCFMLIRVADSLSINFSNIRESVDNECSEQYCVRNFIILNWQTCKSLQSLQFRYLNETVNVVILEQKSFQINKPLQFRNIGRADNVVKSDILEWDLHHSFLKLYVIENLKSITIYEQKLITFNLSMARLDEAVISWLLASLVSI